MTMSRGNASGIGRRPFAVGTAVSVSAGASGGAVSASISSMSARVSSSCSTWSRNFSDERPNIARSNLASVALSASISKRCSIIPARAAASAASCS